MKRPLVATSALVIAASVASISHAGINEAKRWVESEFQPSTLSMSEQMQEMEWFINAAKPFQGMEINVLSETLFPRFDNRVTGSISWKEAIVWVSPTIW